MANYSYSQLKMFLNCREQWYYTYVLKNFTKAGKAAQIGSRVHDLIATGGNIFKNQMNNVFWEQEAQEMYRKAVPHIKPLLKDEAIFEKEIIIDYNGDKIKGYIDYLLPVEEKGKKVLNIIDWKTGQRRNELMQLKFYAWLVYKDTEGKYDEYRGMLYFIKSRIKSNKVIYTYPYHDDKNSPKYKKPKFHVLNDQDIYSIDEMVGTTINEMIDYRERSNDEIEYTPSNDACRFCNFDDCPFRAVPRWQG